MGGFRLPTLAVARIGKHAPHGAAPVAAGRFTGRSIDERRNERSHAAAARVNVNVLGVVPRVGGEGGQANAPLGLIKGLMKVREVRPRTTLGHDREDEVALAVAQDSRFGEPPIGHGLLEIPAFCLAAHVIVAGVVRLQPGTVERRQGDRGRQLANNLCQPHGQVQKTAGLLRPQQPLGRFLERAVIGHLLKLDDGRQLGRVPEQILQATVIAMQAFLQHQAREELGLRVRLGTKLVGIVRQRQLANQIANRQDLARRFAVAAIPIWRYAADTS